MINYLKSYSYDQQADAAYLVIQEGTYFVSEELSNNIILDFDKNHTLLGIEILNAREEIKKHPELFTNSRDSSQPNEILNQTTISDLSQTYYFALAQVPFSSSPQA